MAEIIHLDRFRQKLAADQGFRTWLSRFQEQFGPDTRLKDLSPRTLLFLATPGDEHLFVYFDLIMGVKKLGGSARFRLDELEAAVKLKIMDAALALMDRVRFEVMRRLGWVEEVPGAESPLIDLVAQAWESEEFARALPHLSPLHPDYGAYLKLSPLDRAVFLRRLIPKAVAEFKAWVEGD